MTTTSPPSFREEVKGLLNDRLLDAALEMTLAEGWVSITMAKVAERAGVSRQTVYNEFGNKAELANALVLRELSRFLDVVRERLMSADDVVTGVERAVEGALLMAEDNQLIRAALSQTEQDADLIAHLTTDSTLVLTISSAVIIEVINEKFPDLPITPNELRMVADMTVRLVLSHITRPAETPAEVGRSVAWILSHLLNQPLS
jgi:AcrR family transcriptional regulator